MYMYNVYVSCVCASCLCVLVCAHTPGGVQQCPAVKSTCAPAFTRRNYKKCVYINSSVAKLYVYPVVAWVVENLAYLYKIWGDNAEFLGLLGGHRLLQTYRAYIHTHLHDII